MSISIHQLTHQFDDETVLKQIDLAVDQGEVLCVLGPSGSGKSTLLRLIAGLERVQSGQLRIGNECEVTPEIHVPPERRRVGLVFQDHALFPHMTIRENVAFGTDGKAEQKIASLLSSVDLADFADRYPHTLSGGQQQRVALIRALANEPVVMLLDEPFASVDVALRISLRDDALSALKLSSTSTVLVTHDPEEAMLMADRIACLIDGEIVQIGTPEELWSEPQHPFVAQAISGSQLIEGVARDRRIETPFGFLDADSSVTGNVKVCVNKKDVELVVGDRAEVKDVRFVDGLNIVSIKAGQHSVAVATDEKSEFVPGDSVNLKFTKDRARVYPA